MLVEGGPFPGISRAAVARWAAAMLRKLELTECELSILLTDDSGVRRLNKRYREIDRPTDVLSFSQREGEPLAFSKLLGDVVISVPTARRQAGEQGISVAMEVARLLAHGLLHLIGLDHDTAPKDRRMKAEVDRLCAGLETRGVKVGLPLAKGKTRARRSGYSRSKSTPRSE